MADNSGDRRKALIVGVLAFLFAGGGVFLFFVVQGSNDLTGAGKKGAFTYGGVAREVTTSFFKFAGFDDVESVAKEGPKERPRMKEYEAAGLLPAAPAADEGAPWAPPAGSGRSASPSYVPKMAARGGSGVGGLGGGGTSSSGGVARFGEGSGSGNTRVSGRAPEGAGPAASKGAFGTLKSARAMLGEGLRSGSAMTAKGKWDASFGVGQTGGGGGELAYGKAGLVNLDKIKKGEVDSLKMTEKGSLKVPAVSPPERDKSEEAASPALQKAKETAEDAIKKSMASSMAGALGKGFSGGQVKDAALAEDKAGPNSLGEGLESGSCAPEASSPICDSAGAVKMDSDANISYEQIGATSEGKIFKVNYSGLGPGITEQYKGQTVAYNDACNVLLRSDGSVKIIGWLEPVESVDPAAAN